MSETQSSIKQKWEAKAKSLVGLTITNVRWMDAEERDAYGWSRSAVVIECGLVALIAMCDDEGNGPGAIATTSDKLPILPVI